MDFFCRIYRFTVWGYPVQNSCAGGHHELSARCKLQVHPCDKSHIRLQVVELRYVLDEGVNKVLRQRVLDKPRGLVLAVLRLLLGTGKKVGVHTHKHSEGFAVLNKYKIKTMK